jgi:hypothetical protein
MTQLVNVVDPAERSTKPCLTIVADPAVVLTDPSQPTSWFDGSFIALASNAHPTTAGDNFVCLILPKISVDSFGMSLVRALTRCADAIKRPVALVQHTITVVYGEDGCSGVRNISTTDTVINGQGGDPKQLVVMLYGKEFFDFYGPGAYHKLLSDSGISPSVTGAETLNDALAHPLFDNDGLFKFIDVVTKATDGMFDHHMVPLR